jgi:hypothetical protein
MVASYECTSNPDDVPLDTNITIKDPYKTHLTSAKCYTCVFCAGEPHQELPCPAQEGYCFVSLYLS